MSSLFMTGQMETDPHDIHDLHDLWLYQGFQFASLGVVSAIPIS